MDINLYNIPRFTKCPSRLRHHNKFTVLIAHRSDSNLCHKGHRYLTISPSSGGRVYLDDRSLTDLSVSGVVYTALPLVYRYRPTYGRPSRLSVSIHLSCTGRSLSRKQICFGPLHICHIVRHVCLWGSHVMSHVIRRSRSTIATGDN